MNLLFCDNGLDAQRIEPDLESEARAAQTIGLQTNLLSHEELVVGNLQTALKQIKPRKILESGIYRGWMMTPDQYQAFYESLLSKNIQLINDPKAYTHCHYLPSSYKHIQKHTPTSYWTTDLSDEGILKAIEPFHDQAIIIKDFVKSEKHYWKEACFIPNAANTDQVLAVVRRFLDLRGSYLNKGLVFRAFEALEHLTGHSKSDMPLTKEYRIVFLDKKAIQVYAYWDEGVYNEEKPDINFFTEIAVEIESRFFTMDVAKKQDGFWTVMELGDGQVSGLPDHVDRVDYIRQLTKMYSNP